MRQAPLRFVLLADSDQLAAWQVRCLDAAIGSGAAELVGIVQKSPAVAVKAPSLPRRLWAKRDRLIWRAFSRLYVEKRCKATRPEPIGHVASGVPRHHDCPIAVGRFSEKLTPSAIEFIEQVQPDFILRFGFGILKGEVLTAAPLGIWSYHHGDPMHFRGQPPGFWEIFKNEHASGAILQQLSAELDAGRILQRGKFRTIKHSYAKSRDQLYFGGSAWVMKTCRQIQARESPTIGEAQSVMGPVYREPNNSEMARFLWRTAAAFVAMIVTHKIRRQSWNVAVIDAPIHEVAGLSGNTAREAALRTAKWLPVRANEFKADPFGCEAGRPDAIRIFYESFEWKKGVGEISSLQYDGETFDDEHVVLSGPTHLSYPFVINCDGQRYFVPEHAEANDISAFAIDEGAAGSKRTIFAHCTMIDATFVEHEGRYWVFGIIDDTTTNAELHIFHSDSLWGPWEEHEQNPVKTDVTSARPAGAPFRHEGVLYRPAQDCGPHYGSAITINRIVSLTPSEFVEQEVARIEPLPHSDYPYGVHTISSAGNYTLIDGARLESRLSLKRLFSHL